MIRIFKNPNRTTRQSSPRRISNTLAVFAALMLLASTQVGQNISGDPAAAELMQAGVAEQALSTASAASNTANPAPSESAEAMDTAVSLPASTAARKNRKSGLKFNLFLIRG